MDKLNIFGSLTQAKETMVRAEKELGDLWAAGRIRLSEDDIEKLETTLEGIKITKSNIENYIKMFAQITNKNINEPK